MRFTSGYHENDSVRAPALPAGLDGPVGGSLPNSHGAQFHTLKLALEDFAVVNPLEQLIRVGELRHADGSPQVGYFQSLETRQDELLHQPELGPEGDGLFFVLKSFAHGNVSQDDLLWILQPGHFFCYPFKERWELRVESLEL
jgi:hypothetical protein